MNNLQTPSKRRGFFIFNCIYLLNNKIMIKNILNEMSEIRQMMGLVNEQSEIPEYQLKRLEEKKKQGYVDVTDSFNNDQYALQIADGENYEAQGSGYEFEIVTNDGKKTGYLVLIKNGVRGMIKGPIIVWKDGIMVNLGRWTADYINGGRFLYNEKLNQVKVNK
jgi:hypothetical protein